MPDSPLSYAEIVERRRALAIAGYASFADVSLDGPWTTPYHIASKSSDGPVLLTYNYLDAPSARRHRAELLEHGFLAAMPFNLVLDLALNATGLKRAGIYVTHAFHLLPPQRSSVISAAALDISFDTVARHELVGRKVIALGTAAAGLCRRHDIGHIAVRHLSARGNSFTQRAATLAKALGELTYPSA